MKKRGREIQSPTASVRNYRCLVSFSIALLAVMLPAGWAEPAEVLFAPHTISTNADAASSVFAADVDGDGDMDVLSASQADDKIAWYENGGASLPSFTEHAISTNADGARAVFAADVDGDGDMDVLSASSGDDKIAWYENLVISHPSFSVKGGAGQILFCITNDGDLFLKGTSTADLGSISATSGSEVLVKRVGGQIAARIDAANGNLELRGSLTTGQSSMTNPAGSDFVVKDLAGNVVAYITAAGNMVIKGDVQEQFVFQ